MITDNEGHEISLRVGETTLLPAAVQEISIVPEGNAKLLETYV